MKEQVPSCDRCGREIERSREVYTDEPVGFTTTLVNRRTVPNRALAKIEFRTAKEADLCVECQCALFEEALRWLESRATFMVPIVIKGGMPRRTGPIPAGRGGILAGR